MKKKNSDNKGLGLGKTKKESLGELKPSDKNDKETSIEGNGKRRVISKYLHPIFNKISIKKTNTPFSSFIKKDQEEQALGIPREEELEEAPVLEEEPDPSEGTTTAIEAENLVPNEEDSENLEDIEVEEDGLTEESEKLMVSDSNEAEDEQDIRHSDVVNESPSPNESQTEKNGGIFVHDPISEFDWWPDLSDLDRLNIQNAPLEERARLLSAKVSMSRSSVGSPDLAR